MTRRFHAGPVAAALLGCFLAGAAQAAPGPETGVRERQRERRDMVALQIEERGIGDERVLAVMRTVPRHRFIPRRYQRQAYGDHPIPIGYGQTISQPYIVAYMTQALDLLPDDRVLEVGTGSGYQAAIAAEITPHVFTMEIVPDLASSAAARLRELGYDRVRVKQGDGYFGWEEEGPWDAILVTAAAEHVPPPLVAQLKPGGRMCIPVGSVFFAQYLLLIEKKDDGGVTTRSLLPVRFVPLVGGKRD